MNIELQKAVKARRKAKKIATKFPTPENKTELNKHTAKVRLLTRQGKKGKWIKTCEDLNLNRECKKACKLLQNIQGKGKKENPKPVQINNSKITDRKKEAYCFNRYLAHINTFQEGRIFIKPFGVLLKQN